MSATVKIGISRDLFDENEHLVIPGPGLKLLDGMEGVGKYSMLRELLRPTTAEQVRDFDIVISAAAPWTEESVSDSERLLAVLLMGVGYDQLDVPALTRDGVMVCTAPDGVRRPMAVTIITHMLALATKLVNKDKLTREGRWAERAEYKGEGVTGKTLGCIGAGNIGQEMLRLAQPFGMRLLVCDPYLSPDTLADFSADLVDLDTLLVESDFVSVSVPLSNATRKLIGAPELARMKSSAYLINTSRGAVVDEAALTDALKSGVIRGAGLDVFEKEPVDPDNLLLQMENVVVSPHNLCHTDEYWMGAWDQKLRQAAQILAGQVPEALVNPDVLETTPFKAKFSKFQC